MSAATVLVYGSELAKVDNYNSVSANERSSTKSFTNKPLSFEDMFDVSGSDASLYGWVEVSGEDGATDTLWYLKAEGETRLRFTDYCEMTCLLKVSDANDTDSRSQTLVEHCPQGGTEGLFALSKIEVTQHLV